MRNLHAIAVFCLSLAVVHAQGLSTSLTRIDASQFPEISVDLTVFTEAGKPVPGLTKDDFTVDEDGAKVSVVSVALDKTPLSVALVIDVSGSMGPSMGELKRALGDFIRSLEPSDHALLITFSDSPVLKQGLTDNMRALLDAAQAIKAGGATALFDAIQMGLTELEPAGGRRLVVVFTDGVDQNNAGTAMQSAYSAKGVALLARKLKIPLWTIGLGREVSAKLLKRLAEVTGGQAYLPSRAAELRRAFGNVLTDVRLRYRVTYRTPKDKPDGTERHATVTSATQGHTGQGKISYTAPEPAPDIPSPSPGASPGVLTLSGTMTGYVKAEVQILVQDRNVMCKVWPGGGVPRPPTAELSSIVTPFTRPIARLHPGKWVFEFTDAEGNDPVGSFELDLKPQDRIVLKVSALPGHPPEISRGDWK